MQTKLAQRLAALHIKGNPLVLYNAWDAGSAKAIAEAGAQAIATSSWAVAAAHGYDDGEAIPFGFVEQIVGRIAQSVSLPVTVDVEGGYSEDPETCAAFVGRLMDAGVVGINIEDRVINGAGLHDIVAQGDTFKRAESVSGSEGARGGGDQGVHGESIHCARLEHPRRIGRLAEHAFSRLADRAHGLQVGAGAMADARHARSGKAGGIRQPRHHHHVEGQRRVGAERGDRLRVHQAGEE